MSSSHPTTPASSPTSLVGVGRGGGRGTYSGISSPYPLSLAALGCLFKTPSMRFPKRPLAAFHFSSLSLLSSRLLSSVQKPRGCRRWGSGVPMTKGGDYDSGDEVKIWSSFKSGERIPIGKQIFCNRSLNMKNITAVGFDMDYTLAQYKPETFEALAYQGTVEKLVNDLQYPREISKWQFDWKYMVRGLVLDKKRGNILKMDRHKYVKVAYHGFREMSKEEKVSAYGTTLIRDSFDEPDYALIDTLFSLAEAYLFAQLVDFMDNNPEKFPSGTDYARMYRDVRSAVDLCHRDGTLKKMVAEDPGRYINEDKSIVPMLEMIQKSGRATFLVTNSLWDYTNVVMNFLCGSHNSDDASLCSYKWVENFDVVITGSSKPYFFLEDNRTSLFEVEPKSGMLLNADLQVRSPRLTCKVSKSGHKVYQGGSVAHLHRLLSIAASSQVLYVGDHIYGDILRSKKVLGWRTMLVIPELEEEVKLLSESKHTCKELQQLRKERDHVEDRIDHLEWSLKNESDPVEQKEILSSRVDNLKLEREHVRGLHQDAQRKYHQKVGNHILKLANKNINCYDPTRSSHLT